MRILYIGCVESSYLLLEKLIEAGADIVGVITKKESNYNSDFRDLVPLCEKKEIPYELVENINEEKVYKFIENIQPEIAFCFGWSQLIKDDIIQKIPQGIIGFHPAALPKNRGRHPIIWALVLGLQETASTFFMMDASADTGDIVSQKIVKISYEDDAATLYQKIMTIACEQVVELWEQLQNGTANKIKQDVIEGNSWRKRSKKDGEIDWRMSGRSIYNLVRGLTKPYVGAHFVHQGKEIKVWKVCEIDTDKYENIEPGKILDIYENGDIDIKTGDNVIRLIEYESVELKCGEYL